MKIRASFVSNSSTTSFVIYGVAIKNLLLPSDWTLQEDGDTCISKDGKTSYQYDIFQDELTFYDLSMYYNDSDGLYYIGKDWNKNDSFESRKEFKLETEKIIRDMFNKNEWSLDGLEFDTYASEIES